MHRTADLAILELVIGGHRENYAKIVADIMQGRLILGKVRGGIRAAFFAKNLIVPTLESAPKIYIPLVLVRGLLGLRSYVIVTRSHVNHPGRPFWNTVRRVTYRLMASLPAIQLSTITPPDPRNPRNEVVPGMQYIQDLEFWDLSPGILESRIDTEISNQARKIAGGRKLLLVAGGLSLRKGLAFLANILDREPKLLEKYAIVCAGRVHTEDADIVSKLEKYAVVWEDRAITDIELFSLYHAADVVWCCYHPTYDVSSGIFGRSVQFGIPTIVRCGSLLEMLQHKLSSGICLPFSDENEAANRLLSFDGERSHPSNCRADGEARLRTFVEEHFSIKRNP